MIQLELRFYFQQGLKPAAVIHIREHHPDTLDKTIECALRFDHTGQRVDWQATPLQRDGTYHTQLPVNEDITCFSREVM